MGREGEKEGGGGEGWGKGKRKGETGRGEMSEVGERRKRIIEREC